jgi:hypothetical protein
MRQLIINKMINRIRGHGRGWIFSTKDFFDCGNRFAVNMALYRLKEKGMIRQILRGIYDYPKFIKLFNDLATPDPYRVTIVIANSFGWSISPSGETALNLLGLSTQVPAKLRYFSDGPSKKYRWGGMELEFTHRAIKETNELSYCTALVVQALKALGKQHVDDEIIAALRKKLTANELRKALQETQVATNWVYDTLKRIANEGKNDG